MLTLGEAILQFIVLLLGEGGGDFDLVDGYLASETGLVVELLLLDQLGNLDVLAVLFEAEVECID